MFRPYSRVALGDFSRRRTSLARSEASGFAFSSPASFAIASRTLGDSFRALRHFFFGGPPRARNAWGAENTKSEGRKEPSRRTPNGSVARAGRGQQLYE